MFWLTEQLERRLNDNQIESEVVMSEINDMVIEIINNYKIAKTGQWNKPESPPEPEIDFSDVYSIGKTIISKLEGLLSDKLIKRPL